MAMPRPVAVVIRAWATPAVTSPGFSIPADPSISKEVMIPSTVPRMPSRGATVIMVSSTPMKRCMRWTSSAAAASMALSMEKSRCRMPLTRMRTTKSRLPWVLTRTASQSPQRQSSSTSSTRERLRWYSIFSQNRVRSMMTVKTIREQASRGYMIGPPFLKTWYMIRFFPKSASGASPPPAC